MNIEPILKYTLPSFGLVFAILLIVFLYPDKVEIWSSILWRIINFLIKRGEKKIIAHDIQGRINEFSKSLKKEIVNYEPVGIKIQWIVEKEQPEEFFRENRLIIRMREHSDQDKNFVYASMIFISKAILTKTKIYLSPSQRESLDLHIGRKLFEKEKPHVVDRFFEDYFAPKALTKDKIMELLEKYNIIDKVGIFFPVLIQELSFLGEKVFYKPRSDTIIKEVTEFINFLVKYAEREIGEQEIPKNYEGAYCRCGIVIIAKSVNIDKGKVDPFINYIEKLVAKKLENIYLIGSSIYKNKSFIDKISQEVQNKFSFEKYISKEYISTIKFEGKRITVDSYLVLLRSPETLRYYDKEYQENYVETVTSVS